MAALALAGCGERPQVIEYKQGKYQGKPDEPPYAAAPFNGNKGHVGVATSATRTQNQNEYKRIGSYAEESRACAIPSSARAVARAGRGAASLGARRRAQSPAVVAAGGRPGASSRQQQQVAQPLNNQPLWREVRSGEPQITSIRGRETNVLIQPAGPDVARAARAARDLRRASCSRCCAARARRVLSAARARFGCTSRRRAA